MFRAGSIGRHVRQVDVSLRTAGELNLGLLGGFFQALQGQHVLAQINPLLFLELSDDEVNDALVKIFAAQERVAVGGQNFKLLFAVNVGNFNDGHVKSATTQVKNRDFAVAFFSFVQAVSQCCSGRFVDDAFDIESGNATRVFGGLTLCVIEISRHRNNGLGDGFAQVVLGRLFHFAQHIGADLLGRHPVAAHFDPGVTIVSGCNFVRHQVDVFLDFLLSELAANQPLDGVQRVLRVGHRLTLGRGADQYFAVFLISNDGRRGARPFRVFNDLGRVALHDGDATVGRAQIDADDSSHDFSLNESQMLLTCGSAENFQVTMTITLLIILVRRR